MKRSLLVIVGIFMMLSALVYAQDPDDPGMPDSLIFSGVDVNYSPGSDIYVDVPVYFVTDDSIASVMIPIEWASTDGNITCISATWGATLENWEDVYHSDDLTWFVGFHDLGGEGGEPLLFTDGARVQELVLEFHISAEAEEQLVWITIGEGPNGLPLNFGLMTTTTDEDITPIVSDGYIRYGAVDIDDNSGLLPTEYAINQNYPNPFNPETNIEYQLPTAGYVDISVYNILGQNVKTLVAENQQAGIHKAHWNGANNDGEKVPSGIYFYTIKADKFSDTKKMIMLK